VTVPDHKELAKGTLRAIIRDVGLTVEEFTELSSGYKLAMRDLEIRGAGTVLGAEQHGHMMAVGFNLYSRLLREAVRKMKGEVVEAPEEAVVDIKVNAYIPDGYVADNEMKIDIYRRIRDTEAVDAMDVLRGELQDRFGTPPSEVEALLEVQALRLSCRTAGVKRVVVAKGHVEAEFAKGREPGPSQIRQVLESCEVPLEFDASEGLRVRFPAPRDRREALRMGRTVLKSFGESASLKHLRSGVVVSGGGTEGGPAGAETSEEDEWGNLSGPGAEEATGEAGKE
jgi:transcription-repair coupling factor (superfamily II helicase)